MATALISLGSNIGDRAATIGRAIDELGKIPDLRITAASSLQQTQPAGAPYTLGIAGHLPGEAFDVGLCFYKQSDADKGGYYPCCKVNVTLETPPLACEP